MVEDQKQRAIFAGSGNRAVAFLLDLILVTFSGPLVTDLALPGSYVFAGIAFLYFAGMPLSPLQGTLGKWICRIKLCDRSGNRLTWRASAVRTAATMCWFGIPVALASSPWFQELDTGLLSVLWSLIVLPWAPAGFMPRRESLFDLLAGSVVVRRKATTGSIASAEPVQKPGIFNVAGVVVLCLAFGAMLSLMIGAHHDHDRRVRISYAIMETQALRQEIEAFHGREQRWPTAGELSVPEWNPYPDGGGFRLQADGSILITFSVLPDLKRHSITYRPTLSVDGKRIEWHCSADARFRKAYLPPNCR